MSKKSVKHLGDGLIENFVESLKRSSRPRDPTSLVGRRVRLVKIADEHTSLELGALGTVQFVDDIGTVHVDWDCGSNIGLISGEDEFEVIE